MIKRIYRQFSFVSHNKTLKYWNKCTTKEFIMNMIQTQED